MKMSKICLLGMLVLLLSTTAQAGFITPGLESQLAELPENETIKVLVVMAEQPDIRALDLDLHYSRASLANRHSLVMETLQDVARSSQEDLLTSLESRRADNSILGYSSHWLVNSVVVVGTADAIRELAAREDVERVEANLVIELIEPVPSQKIVDPSREDRGIGITPGVVAVGARRVWNELGIDGTGVIVGNLDTGVDGNHPALGSRWRGNYAPASECWLDVIGGAPNFPSDGGGHGTHTMGTITGLANDDTIGVAPGALWIATNVINQGANPGFDNDVIASLEFMTDPDGNPMTTDDLPAVVQNSWRVNENFSGYYDCDSRWWTAIDNCEAAGVCLTWSAGNEGPGSTTIGSPADRADSPTNCFSVGATTTYAPFNIAGFSSRGPSGCGGEFAMKPEIVAPGDDVYSSYPGGSYTYMSGTSMSGPHVAGVVALMRASNPDVDVITIKEVLMATAIDLGAAGEDNTYGHGFVDAYAAVLAVMGGIGYVDGVVTDRDTGAPIEGAVVRKVGGYNSDTTDAMGFYSMTMQAGPVELSFEAFGYEPGTLSLEIIEDETAVGNLALVALPTATVSGVVYAPGGSPVVGAIVTALDTPAAPATTGTDGSYSLVLPAGAGVMYDLQARAAGFAAVTQSIELTGDLTVDFTLPAWFGDDFESGGFTSHEWTMSGSADWIIDGSNAYEGDYCARSADIGDNQNSILSLTMEVTAASNLTFWYKVSSEANYDYLQFHLDGSLQDEWAGEIGWAEYVVAVSPGTHTFRWTYDKDYSVSDGSDSGFIDFVEFPQASQASITLDVGSFDVSLVSGSTTDVPLNIGNTGGAPLDFAISLYEIYSSRSRVENPVPFWTADKQQEDARDAVDPLTSSGGPDAFGYTWQDSESDGPAYGWVDIAASGTHIAGSDEAVYGPLSLGFDFTYYGNTYDAIHICTDGWLSFTSTAAAYINQGIPESSNPNDMIAMFWDDLNPADEGDIYWLADTGNDRFIVQFDGVFNWGTGQLETFQAILNADGSIVLQYESVGNPAGCTVGIENYAGDDGLLVAFNSDYLQSGLAIGFYPPEPLTWVTANPLEGVVAPSGNQAVDVSFDATGMSAGQYHAEMLINSNDPNASALTLPVTLTVTNSTAVEDQLPSKVKLDGAVPNPFNPATDIKFSLPRQADVTLNLYDVSGRLVRALVAGNLDAGHHDVRWNGRDDAGRSVASGTYFARLVVDGEFSVKAMVLIR